MAEQLKERIVEVLRTIYDPEIPVNIYDLGLVYEINVDEENNVHILMTLTAPACPIAGSLPAYVESKVRALEGVKDVRVQLTWDPPWTPERMSEEARLRLGLM